EIRRRSPRPPPVRRWYGTALPWRAGIEYHSCLFFLWLQLQRFVFQEFFHPIPPQFAAVAGLLVAAEGRARIEGAAVDVDLAGASEPPHSSSAPSSMPLAMQARTRSRCARETSGPRRALPPSGSPTVKACANSTASAAASA